jgi:hypothetical protein
MHCRFLSPAKFGVSSADRPDAGTGCLKAIMVNHLRHWGNALLDLAALRTFNRDSA